MKCIINSAAVALLVASAGFANANEVIATVVEDGRGKTSIALDMSTDGGVAGFSFKINVPGVSDSGYDLKSCVSELPSGFEGACSVVNGQVLVYAISNRMELTLPSGLVPIGNVTVKVDPSLKRTGEAVSIAELAVGSAEAKELPATARVEADSGRSPRLDSVRER
jgi:hypothetical protein